MEKLKDFLYDKNDILVALVIIVIAGFIITNRIDAIMTYPATLTAEKQGNIIESDLTAKKHNNGSNDDSSTGNDDTQDNMIQGAPDMNTTDDKNITGKNAKDKDATDKNAKDKDTADKNVAPHSLYIEPGSSTTIIAENLVNGGILKTRTEFLDAVTAVSADNKLKAGTFIIPAGSTAAEIVAILTK